MRSNISVLSIKKDRLIKHRYRGNNIVERDISKYLVQCLPNYCHIEEGTTLGDIFRLISPHRQVLSEIFHSFYFDEYMEEAEGLINQRSEKYDDSDILVVRVISDKTYNNYEYPHELCGIDDIVTDINHPYKEEIGKHPYTSIHLADLSELINCRIILKNDSIFNSRAYSDTCKRKFERETKNCSVILFDLLRIIFWELSWYGSPIQKNKINEELIDCSENEKFKTIDFKDNESFEDALKRINTLNRG